jgi:hypothetical protein
MPGVSGGFASAQSSVTANPDAEKPETPTATVIVQHLCDALAAVHERLMILPALVDPAMFDVLRWRAIPPCSGPG